MKPIDLAQIHAAPILVVDDEPANVRLLERILAQNGFTRVIVTTDSREARRGDSSIKGSPSFTLAHALSSGAVRALLRSHASPRRPERAAPWRQGQWRPGLPFPYGRR